MRGSLLWQHEQVSLRLYPACATFLGFFACFFVAFHLVTALHELVGHGLTAWMSGAVVTDMHVSWMGASGYVSWDGTISGPARLWVAWGGILSTSLATLGLTLFIRMRPPRAPSWGEALVWCCWVCLGASSFGYTILGLHSGYGDPAASSEYLARAGWLALAVYSALAAHVLLVGLQARALAGMWSGYWRHARVPRALLRVVAIVGFAALCVAVLNGAESRLTEKGQSLAAFSQPRWLKRVEDELVRYRDEVASGLSDSDARVLVEQRRAQLVAANKPWPLARYVYYPGIALGVLAGLWAGLSSRRGSPPELRPSVPSSLTLLVGAVALSLLISALL